MCSLDPGERVDTGSEPLGLTEPAQSSHQQEQHGEIENEFPAMRRTDVELRATGALRPGAPITVEAVLKGNRSSAGTSLEILVLDDDDGAETGYSEVAKRVREWTGPVAARAEHPGGIPAIDAIHRNGAFERGEHKLLARAERAIEPDAIGLPAEVLDERLFRGHEHVLLEGVDSPVVGELLAPIVALGRVGEDLDDDLRIEHAVAHLVPEDWRAADDRDVGVEKRFVAPSLILISELSLSGRQTPKAGSPIVRQWKVRNSLGPRWRRRI
jgi:hypothetical protein